MADARAWWDALAEGVVLVTAGRVTDLNAAAAALLDVQRERALGAALIAVVRDHRIEEAWHRQQATELELRGRRVAVAPTPTALLLRDVTERRRAEEDARELLAVLSHELRTPVSSIRAVLDALAADPDPALAQRFLPRAIAEGERLTRLLDDLTVDVKPPRVRRVPIQEALERALQVLQAELERRGVTVRVSVPAALVLVDADKLLQVLVNLLENAAVHGPGNADVEVVGEVVGEAVDEVVGEHEGRWLRLEVRDRGTPLDPAAVDPLFAPHSRGRGTGSGTGLGLYIVRSIAAAWGGEAWGRAWIADGGERGNAFGVTVPLAPE